MAEDLSFDSPAEAEDLGMNKCALSMGAWSAWAGVGDAMRTEILRSTDAAELSAAEDMLNEARERIDVRLREIAHRRVELTSDALIGVAA
jgi:hypothetical protein